MQGYILHMQDYASRNSEDLKVQEATSRTGICPAAALGKIQPHKILRIEPMMIKPDKADKDACDAT